MANTIAHSAHPPPAGAPFAHEAEIERLARHARTVRERGDANGAADLYARIAALAPLDPIAAHNAGATLLEAGRLAEAGDAFARSVALRPTVTGWSMLGHVAALAGNMRESRAAYERALEFDPHDFTAHWGLFEVAQVLDDNAAALRHQRAALAQRSLVSLPAQPAAHTTILELCIAGTFQANIPLDFILDPQRFRVHKLYLGEHPVPPLPAYDLIFNTIADAPNAGPALDAAQRFIALADRPALNAPGLVPLTSRDHIADCFGRSQCVAVAATRRAARADVAITHPAFPFLIRPLDSHAGNDLAKIDDAAQLSAYLAATPHADDFYVSDFIDYRNADGYFRKYRIVFVAGVPYPVHLAISPRWMIHYYNAPMEENAWMRDEEHAFMRDMDAVFSGPCGAGLREIAQALPLEYFGIDCSIAADGRLLLFEASTAMIVHMRDPVDLFPYKALYVPRVIRALEALVERRVRPGGAR